MAKKAVPVKKIGKKVVPNNLPMKKAAKKVVPKKQTNTGY